MERGTFQNIVILAIYLNFQIRSIHVDVNTALIHVLDVVFYANDLGSI